MSLLNNQNPSKNRIAYLGALSLLFSYAELFIPKIVPFFKLGLSNVPVLMGLELSPWPFLLLLLIKAFCSSMMSGTLCTPFFLISLIQTFGSGILMFVLFRMNPKGRKIISLYGISVAGSALSASLQIWCCKFYLGSGTLILLGPMLLFSVVAGLITAFLVYALELPEETPEITNGAVNQREKSSWFVKLINRKPVVTICFILVATVLIFMMKDWYILLAVMIFCLFIQFLSGRHILIPPYVFLWIFIILCCLIVPQGQILFSFWKINVTYGALMEGLTKAMILTSVAALSQCMTQINFVNESSFLALIFKYYQALRKVYNKSSGNFIEKLKAALSASEL